ncbi:uncharacterized protein JCM15063_000443 [Sporobolomyces koalae]|uniref:uncharacterized protein n=1 Tax=Sporobolomyces koalae TaxID=500713 RepID=UPI003177B860
MGFDHGHIVGPATSPEIEAFLTQWAPSANRAAPTGWIWCHLAQQTDTKESDHFEKPAEHADKQQEGFDSEGLQLVANFEARCREIKVQTRHRSLTETKESADKSERAGDCPRSRKEGIREEEHDLFRDKVKTLAQKYNVLSGKWLFFPSAQSVDPTWGKIVRALADADGALAKSGVVDTAKVAAEAADGEPYVICVYVKDSWNRQHVGTALECLVKDLQLQPSAYKTLLGIDSKHESGIKSSLYSKYDFMTKDEIESALAVKNHVDRKDGMDDAGKQKKTFEPKEVKKKTIAQEQAQGLGDFDDLSDSDEEPPQKRSKIGK